MRWRVLFFMILLNASVRGEEYSTSFRYDTKEGWGLFLYGDFLYWQAIEDHIEYAVASYDVNGVQNLEVLPLSFDWHPGVRIGAGMHLDTDDWELLLEWTHLVSHNGSASFAPQNGILATTRSQPSNGFVSSLHASSDWRCIYNTGDILLGRPAYMGKQLVIKPYIAARGFWIWQSLDTEYQNVNLGSGTLNVNESYRSWGLGPLLAVQSVYLIGEGFNIFGSIGSSLLYTRYYPVQTESLNGQEISQVSYQQAHFQIRPNMDAALGFGWGSYLDDQKWHVDFSLAYEFHYWWGQNSLPSFTSSTQQGLFAVSGDLALQGGTVRVRFDF